VGDGDAARPGLSPELMKLARAMTEADLQNKITAGSRREPGICRQLGLRWYHTHDSRRSTAGFPDLVIVGPAAGEFWELKREKEKPTDAQERWLAALAMAGFTVKVRRPSDFLTGRIARELAVLASRRVA